MFSVSDLIVEVRDSSLARVGQLTEIDLDGFKLFGSKNGVGSWQVVLPAKIRQESGTLIDHPLAVALVQPGAGLVVSIPGGRTVSGPMYQPTLAQATDDPNGTWTITGVTDEIVVSDAICYPQPSNSDPTTQTVANDIRSGAAETVMRGLFSDNVGPTASTARKLSWLTVAADQGRGSTIQVSPRYTNMLEVFQTACLVGGLGFQVSQVGSNLQLGFYVPVDRSATIRMDVWNDQLESSEWSYSAPTVTDVIVGGQGDGTLRTMVKRTNATATAAKTAWRRQIERFVDQRNTNDATELAQAGDEALASGGFTITSMKVTPSSDSSMVVGTDWWLGDKVTVVVNGVEVPQIVTEVAIGITQASGVIVAATVGDSTGFEADSVTEARLSDTQARVAALEIAAVNAPVLSFASYAAMVAVVGAPLQWAYVSGGVVGRQGPWRYFPGYGWRRDWITGEFVTYQGSSVPLFCLAASGASYNVSDYPDLAAAYGVASGTFTVTNMGGRVIIGAGTVADANGTVQTFTQGTKGGEITHVLSVSEMPSHTHSGIVPVSLVNAGGAGAYTWGVSYDKNYSGGNLGHSTYATGSSTAHSLMQPWQAQNVAIRY